MSNILWGSCLSCSLAATVAPNKPKYIFLNFDIITYTGTEDPCGL